MNLPQHLAGYEAQGLQPGEPIAQFELGPLKNFVYLVLDWESKKAGWIDPQSDLTAPLTALHQNEFELTSIFLTHTHPDHIAGLPELLPLYPNLTVYLHPADLHRIPQSIRSLAHFHEIKDQDPISLGSLKIIALHTPGHSTGECCFLLNLQFPFLFTGDTVFIRDCGRTDLHSGSNEDMFRSLQRIKTLNPHTIILPGHHYQKECASFLGQEIKDSPPLQCQSVQELAALP